MSEFVMVKRELLERVASDKIGMSAKKDREAAAFELRAVLAQEAGKCERQPEPIYQVRYLGDGGGGWFDVEKDEFNLDKHHKNYHTRTMYASPPAPVAVVLPVRKPIPDQATFVGGNSYFCKMFDEARGYNQALDDVQACLDKVKELNQ